MGIFKRKEKETEKEVEPEIGMRIITPHNQIGWIVAVIDGHWVQAKVHDEKQTFSLRGGRILKLSISKTAFRNEKKNFLEQMCLNFDGGHGFNNTPPGLLDKVIEHLESLPLLVPKNQYQDEVVSDAELSSNDETYQERKRLRA